MTSVNILIGVSDLSEPDSGYMSAPSQKSVQASKMRSAEPWESICTLSEESSKDKGQWLNKPPRTSRKWNKKKKLAILVVLSLTNRLMRWLMGGWRLVKWCSRRGADSLAFSPEGSWYRARWFSCLNSSLAPGVKPDIEQNRKEQSSNLNKGLIIVCEDRTLNLSHYYWLEALPD